VPAGGGLPESLHAAFLRLCSVLRFFFVGSCHHKPRGASISMPASAAAPCSRHLAAAPRSLAVVVADRLLLLTSRRLNVASSLSLTK
jgi:hypothetical protein